MVYLRRAKKQTPQKGEVKRNEDLLKESVEICTPRGQVRAVSFYQSSAEKFHPSLPLAKWSGKCYYETCFSS